MRKTLTWDTLEQVIAAAVKTIPTEVVNGDAAFEADARGLLRTCGIMALVTEEQYQHHFCRSDFIGSLRNCTYGYGCWVEWIREAIRDANLKFLGQEAEVIRGKMEVVFRMACLFMLDDWWRTNRPEATI